MHLYLIRHTTVQIPADICYGRSDVDVAATFTAEQKKVRDKLAGISWDAVYSSPLQRCTKLANTLTVHEIFLDDRLKELHFGDWEMQAWNDIPRDILDSWAGDYVHSAPPHGESFSQLHARVKAFIAEISPHSQHKNIAVVTHGGVIRALLAEALQLPLQRAFEFSVAPASVTQISWLDAVPQVGYINR